MNILVTGRVDKNEAQQVSIHVLRFMRSAGEFECYKEGKPCYKKRPDIPDFDFALQHLGNPDTEDILTKWKEEGKIDKVIIFHSSGRTKKAVAYCKKFGIPLLTSLPTKNSILKLKWDEVKLKPPNNFALAEILQPKPIGVGNLIAISILCQGYLAVHARKENGGWGPKEILPALRQMGWLDFIGGPGKSLLPKDLDERKSDVRQARWWLGPFELVDKDGIIKEKWGKFEESLKKECGKGNAALPNGLTNLLGVLGQGKDVSKCEIVADAYCAIVEYLGGAPCDSN